MFRKHHWLFIASLTMAATSLSAQSTLSAPVPVQLNTSQTVFIANAGGPDDYASVSAYNAFYQGLLASKRYQLVARPTEAKLDFEISLPYRFSNGVNGALVATLDMQLNIRDVKTQSILWSMTTNLSNGSTPSAKDLTHAVSQLLFDLQDLLAGHTPAPAVTPSKTRFSQTK